MQSLTNRTGEIIAYHYQNFLIHTDKPIVIGLVLGNCVFNQHAEVIGKLFQQKIYHASGKILAVQSENSISDPLPEIHKDLIFQAWKILVQINDHNCVWIIPKTIWAESSLAEYLFC